MATTTSACAKPVSTRCTSCLTSVPLSIKTGAQWRETLAQTESFNRRWNYLGTTALPADPSMITYDQVKTGRRMPQWTTSMFIDERTPKDPTLWSEDLYYALQQRYTGTRSVTETVTATYFMAQGKFGKEGILGRTSFLGGVRMEKTEDDSFGWVRARIGSTTAQQVADPVGSATRDYAGTRRVIQGSYTKSFPSIHLTHDITPNLKARLSWSTSFGRPGFGELFPNETVNENAQTLTINNASLLPQNAKNWDASLDYYFEPVGNFSVGFFQKTIKDFIVRNINIGTVASGQDNGYNGDYAGFTEFTSANARHGLRPGLGVQLSAAVHVPPGPAQGPERLRQLHADRHPRRFWRCELPQRGPGGRIHSEGRQRDALLALQAFQHPGALQLDGEITSSSTRPRPWGATAGAGRWTP